MLESLIQALGTGLVAAADDQAKSLVQHVKDYIECIGVTLSLIGAVLVAQKTARLRQTGFAIWIVSNICLIALAITIQKWWLLGMYAVFTVTSSCGWWNNRPGSGSDPAAPS